MKRNILFLASLFYFYTNTLAQTDTSSSAIHTLSGSILNENNTPLPYVNIINLNSGKGTISNENGNFSINTHSLNDTNIIRFQCIGYKTKDYNIANLKSNSIILLSENIYALDEILILGATPEPENIVKNILQNKEINYNRITKKEQLFVRERNTGDIIKLKLDYTKNNITEITSEMLQQVKKLTPKHHQSYADMLAHIYIKDDDLKCSPIKTVVLKEADIKELKSLGKTFVKILKDTQEKEFWRIKTGIIGQKIPSSEIDSLRLNTSNTISINKYKTKIQGYLDYATFKDKKQWEFLYKTNKYNFEIIGGTTLNSENVYIIDFSPKENGLYQGRLYISIETYALIRADYEYAPNKLGTNIQMLGVGFTQTNFSGSIYFEKDIKKYNLKYLSFQDNNKFSLNRKIALQKKKKRLLINKKLKEMEVAVDIVVAQKESVEILVIDHFKISDIEFDNFIEKNQVNFTYVNQFNEDLWKNHTIIKPTQQMKEYKKIVE